MTTALNRIESILYRLVTAPSGVAEGIERERSLPAGGLAAIVRGDARLSAEDRVGIYANMYFYRILEVLKEDYPATRKVLGDNGFHNLVTSYLIDYPPTEPSIAHAGQRLPDFVRDHPMRREFPYLAELASLERALIDVFHAPDAVALDSAAMRAVPPSEWGRVRMRLHPATRILDCEWRVADVLSAAENGGEITKPAHQPASILVWRRNCQVFHRELDDVERRALQVVSRGGSFSRICEQVASTSTNDDSAAEMNRLLARWLPDGILIRQARRRSRASR